MGKGLNVLYDGSAIPYKGKNAELVKQAVSGENGQRKYQVDAFAVDTFMDIPSHEKFSARAENLGAPTSQRVVGRFENAKRSLPWPVTLDKHSRAINAFLDATQDPKLTNVFLINNDGQEGQEYIAAHAFTLKDEQRKLVQDMTPKSYTKLLEERGVPSGDIEKIPALTEDNIGYTLSLIHI